MDHILHNFSNRTLSQFQAILQKFKSKNTEHLDEQFPQKSR